VTRNVESIPVDFLLSEAKRTARLNGRTEEWDPWTVYTWYLIENYRKAITVEDERPPHPKPDRTEYYRDRREAIRRGEWEPSK
jgi:hypothetical protein